MSGYQPDSHKSNSYKSKHTPNTEKKLKKVISGSAKQRKKNEFLKIADSFIADDVGDLKRYILAEVILPAVKKAVSEIVDTGLKAVSEIVDTGLFGESGQPKRNAAASKVSYNNIYSKFNDRGYNSYSRTKTAHHYDDIVLDTRIEADDVLSRMDELVATWGCVSVADLYDLVGVKGNHTDNKYGWTDIRSAQPIRVRDGWRIKLPKVVPLNYN